MMFRMRTTVTLEPDAEAIVRKRMRERNVSFKTALNDVIREGAVVRRPDEPFRTKSADLGVPTVSLDRALQLAADLEDEELVRKMRSQK